MRKLIKFVVTLGYIGVLGLVLILYFLLDYFYFRQDYYPEYFLYIYQLVLFFIFLSCVIKKQKEKRIMDRILSAIAGAVLVGYFSMPICSLLYTTAFGEDIEYYATVHGKSREALGKRNRTIFHYVDIASDKFGFERLDNTKLFIKVKSGTTIVIRKKKSALGSYIAYSDIKILKNQTSN